MTQKEKLYEQVLIAENEYKTLKGQSLVDIEGMKSRSTFAANAKCFTLAELKGRLAIAQEQVKAAKQAKAVEEYFATPEGAKHKAQLEEELETNTRVRQKQRLEYRKQAIALIEPHLGKNWKVTGYDATMLHICLTDPVSEEELFGCYFDLNLTHTIDKDDRNVYSINTSIASGCFDALLDFKKIELYEMFGRIISNAVLMADLKSIMIQSYAANEQANGNIQRINRQLKNPLA